MKKLASLDYLRVHCKKNIKTVCPLVKGEAAVGEAGDAYSWPRDLVKNDLSPLKIGRFLKTNVGNCAFAVTLTEPLTESELAALTIHRHGTAFSILNSLPKAA